MRHRNLKGKLNRTASHRKALFINMASSLIEHEQITTTLAKAKVLKPIVEKLISISKSTSLHKRRLLLSRLRSKDVVNKLIDSLSPRYKSRSGGYVRIIKAGFRTGDNADMAIIELVDRDILVKGAKDIEFMKQKKKLEEAGLLESQSQ